MPCHVVGGVRCQVDHCSLQVCHLSQSTSRDIWQPALHQRPQTLRVDERGVNNPPEKRDGESERERKGGVRQKKNKKHNEIRRHHSSEAGVTASFQSHHFGDKNKPNYPLKKGHGVASLMMFTVGPVALKWLARLRRTPLGMWGRLA